MKRGRSFWLVCGFAFLVFLGGAQAQEKYPHRSVELIVPYGPGGTNDIVARIYREELARTLKVPVVVINRPGGGGVQATLYVARAKKDGYTLLSASGSTMVIAPIITPEATFDINRDFFPLGYFGSIPPSVFAVRNDSPIKSFGEMVEYARKNPGKLKSAVGGLGTAGYCNLLILCANANINIGLIPFKSGGESAIAILGGHVDMAAGGFINMGSHIKAGTLRPLAVVSKTRYPSYPNIPTTAEAGYPYVNYTEGIGLYAPIGLPQSVLRVLIPAVEKVSKKPEVIERAAAVEFLADYKDPGEFRKYIESQTRIWEKVYKDMGLSVK